MRTALVSDMHGNAVAFDAVLAALDRDPPDQVVCLGDVAQGGPEPLRCVELMRERGWVWAQGNTDAWLGLRAPRDFTESISDPIAEVGAWSVTQLGKATSHLESLPLTVGVEIGDALSLTGFHGSPSSFHDVLLPEVEEDEFRGMLGEGRSAVMAGGHTHLQQIRRVGSTLFVNPGSTGAAYDRNQEPESFRLDPWAEYAVITVANGQPTIEFRRVAFDVDALLRSVEVSGIPYAENWFKRYGRA